MFGLTIPRQPGQRISLVSGQQEAWFTYIGRKTYFAQATVSDGIATHHLQLEPGHSTTLQLNGNDIEIKLYKFQGDNARISFNADKQAVRIIREEILSKPSKMSFPSPAMA